MADPLRFLHNRLAKDKPTIREQCKANMRHQTTTVQVVKIVNSLKILSDMNKLKRFFVLNCDVLGLIPLLPLSEGTIQPKEGKRMTASPFINEWMRTG